MRRVSRHTAERLMAEGADVSVTTDSGGMTDYHVNDYLVYACVSCRHHNPPHEVQWDYICGGGHGFSYRHAAGNRRSPCWEARDATDEEKGLERLTRETDEILFDAEQERLRWRT